MAGTRLTPEKITSPFQLMAAWFSMLVLITSVLLTAAAHISRPDWAAGYLVIFTSVVIIVVLGCVTLMLTAFRPHLQEGKEYAQWLKDKQGYSSWTVSLQDKPKRREQRKAATSAEAPSAISRAGTLVSVSNVPGAEDLVAKLRKAGFESEIYNSGLNLGSTPVVNDPAKHQAIWVGARVPFKNAQEAMKIAVRDWPRLKYVELSSDDEAPPDEVHDELFIGGATSTAVDRGLKEWTAADFARLMNATSQQDFHAAIRAMKS